MALPKYFGGGRSTGFFSTAPAAAQGGWITVPSSDGVDIYLADDGNDSNDGLSSGAPKLTIAAGLTALRSGYPDRLLLKRGDTWTDQTIWVKKSGRSATEPLVVATYGTGARPIVKSSTGLQRSGGGGSEAVINYVFVNGIDFYHYKRDPSDPSYDIEATGNGSSLIGTMSYWTIQDCIFRFYVNNGSIQKSTGDYANNITLNRNMFLDSWGREVTPPTFHSQGLYCDAIDALTITDNLFDHNGWNEDVVAVAEKNQFDHNMYIQNNCSNVVVRGNISTYGSSHGLQLRPGGVCDYNLFYANSIAMFAGQDGVADSAEVTNNVIMESGDIGASLRGWGIELKRNATSGLYRGNIIVNRNSANTVAGIFYSSATPVAGDPVLVQDNVIYSWADASGDEIDIPAGNASEFTLTGNIYDGNNQAGTPLSMADDARDMESYLLTLGVTGDISDFITSARSRALGAWDEDYSARAFVDYMKAGYRQL